MNAETKIRTPYGDECRKAAAIREAHARFHDAWQRILADREAELRRIEREGF